ncbi:MAG: hypothetical protein HKL96_11650 [Phycisphaerales bacterium]|nr:hypothetical protein [Phycisphaerales bacterium]
MFRFTISHVVAVAGALAASQCAFAGFYATIPINGSFTGWSTVPVAATNTVDANAPVNITQVKVANDSTDLYILLTFASAITVDDGTSNNQIYTAINSTNNSSASGWNVFSLGKIYANTGYEGNFPFTETAALFNSGGSVTAPMTAVPYAPGSPTTQQEISIPLSATQTDTSPGGLSGSLFPSGQAFTLAFYNSPSPGGGDATFIGPISYTLASAPEPGTLATIAVGVGLLLMLPRIGRRASLR